MYKGYVSTAAERLMPKRVAMLFVLLSVKKDMAIIPDTDAVTAGLCLVNTEIPIQI